ncbi:hypothetical protein BS47DRAFT_114071 [Hydnum rufescens UP504]|uniref:DUF6533 domain-containing protein n=1 Tax=Hydnum rufescens UP504 TaxID=1448309 RepID=A0A9P6AQZ2_9AGAM|nr:hypothetical protein BS47DRAFT_114071 [Hydnum rufescens UP504]
MPSLCSLFSTLLAISLCAASPMVNVATVVPISERMAMDIVEDPHSTQGTINGYIRVAALSIALYDYVSTLPGEHRLYASQPSFGRMSNACILFIAIRYVSIIALVSGSWGFFATGFSAKTCERYHLVAPLTKLFAALISQIIMSIRTYAIGRNSRWVLWTLSTFFILCLVPEILGNAYKRIPLQDTRKNCISGNIVRVAWIHYLAVMVYDTVTMGIATTYLIVNSPESTLASGLSRLLLREGMLYFFALTSANMANLIFFRVGPLYLQTSAASLGEAVTMIMSERIILGLQEWRAIHTSDRGRTNVNSHELGQVSGARRASSHERGGSITGPRGATDHLVLDPVQSVHRCKTHIDDLVGKRIPSEEVDPPMEIRVQVEEEVKFEYDINYESVNMSTNPARR